jgi:hypothetical protein
MNITVSREHYETLVRMNSVNVDTIRKTLETLRHDLYFSRVQNAISILEEGLEEARELREASEAKLP